VQLYMPVYCAVLGPQHAVHCECAAGVADSESRH
jgi:hypothetical protein